MDRFPRNRRLPIFVLDVRDQAGFAFEAESLARAEEFARSPWFARAVGQFCARRRKALNSQSSLSVRAATASEALTYRNFADEFADRSDDVLVADLSEP
jgi:hypothetical protein